MQFPAFVDPQLVVFLREQYAILRSAFQRLNTAVDVCVFRSNNQTNKQTMVLVDQQILNLDSVLDVTKDMSKQWNDILVCPHSLFLTMQQQTMTTSLRALWNNRRTWAWARMSA